MKIINIINSLEYGGAETRVISIMNQLVLKGDIEVTLITLKSDLPLRNRLSPRVTVVSLDIRRRLGLFIAILRVFMLVRRIRPVVVHTHLVHAGIVGRLAAWLARVPLIISTQHNASHPKQRSIIYKFDRMTWSLADIFISISGCTEEYLRLNGYCGRVALIPTGVATRKQTCQSPALPLNEPYILSVGHFRDRQKGQDILLYAFKEILELKPRIRLVFAGDGPRAAIIHRMAQRLEIDASVDFLGNRDDVRVLMRHCEIFVLPSRWEGFGRVLAEAMSEGCAVVATNVEAIPEVVQDKVSGLLVNPESPGEIARACISILNDKKLRSRIKQRAANHALLSFSVERMSGDVEGLYRIPLKL